MEASFPQSLKGSKITLIFKSGDRSDLTTGDPSITYPHSAKLMNNYS